MLAALHCEMLDNKCGRIAKERQGTLVWVFACVRWTCGYLGSLAQELVGGYVAILTLVRGRRCRKGFSVHV